MVTEVVHDITQNTVLMVTKRSAQGSIAVTRANDSALLKDGSVILRAFFDDAILLLRCCYVTSLPGKYSYCPWYTGYNHRAVPLILWSPGLQIE